MSLTARFKKAHSFFAHLILSYAAVYAVCVFLFYLIMDHVISESARAFDRDDIRSECREYAEILHDKKSYDWLAEEVALENFPDSTLFAIRVLDRDGSVICAASQPKEFDFPGGWKTIQAPAPVTKDEEHEVYLRANRRHLQLKSALLPDGRVLQVAKSTAREHVQEGILLRTTLAIFLLASLFTLGNGFWLMAITLKPIRRVTADMKRIIEGGTREENRSAVSSRITELDTLVRLFDVMVQKNATLISAMKDTLDNVAHDFRTPLTRIRNAAEFSLNAREPQASREALLKTLEDIIDDCDTARLQLQNLLDIRALESGFIKLDTQRFDLKNAIAEVADLYSVMADDKQIDLLIDLPETDVPITGDSVQLSQAVANLIDNAVKYTPRGGQVRIKLEANRENVRVTVADNGIGIPEDEHALIWQRLYRSRGARSEKGLGLGLSIVKTIVNAHRGTIAFTSKPGEGTTFVVTLPPQAFPAVSQT